MKIKDIITGEKVDLNQKIEKFNESVFFHIDSQLLKISLTDINYIEAYGDYMKIICTDHTHIMHITIKKLLALLPQEDFFRVHRSFVVRLDRLDEIRSASVRIGSKNIPLSKNERTNLISCLPVVA